MGLFKVIDNGMVPFYGAYAFFLLVGYCNYTSILYHLELFGVQQYHDL